MLRCTRTGSESTHQFLEKLLDAIEQVGGVFKFKFLAATFILSSSWAISSGRESKGTW
jgi:hypothetical protein